MANFVICVDSGDYPASLEVRKLYEVIADESGEKIDHVRIVDESGEDYLYPRKLFIPVNLPAAVERQLLAGAAA